MTDAVRGSLRLSVYIVAIGTKKIVKRVRRAVSERERAFEYSPFKS